MALVLALAGGIQRLGTMVGGSGGALRAGVLHKWCVCGLEMESCGRPMPLLSPVKTSLQLTVIWTDFRCRVITSIPHDSCDVRDNHDLTSRRPHVWDMVRVLVSTLESAGTLRDVCKGKCSLLFRLIVIFEKYEEPRVSRTAAHESLYQTLLKDATLLGIGGIVTPGIIRIHGYQVGLSPMVICRNSGGRPGSVDALLEEVSPLHS